MRALTQNERNKVKRWTKGIGMQRIAKKHNWTNEQLEQNIIAYVTSGTKNNLLEFMDELAAKQLEPANQRPC